MQYNELPSLLFLNFMLNLPPILFHQPASTMLQVPRQLRYLLIFCFVLQMHLKILCESQRTLLTMQALLSIMQYINML